MFKRSDKYERRHEKKLDEEEERKKQKLIDQKKHLKDYLFK